jgi:hypothetical protein
MQLHPTLADGAERQEHREQKAESQGHKVENREQGAESWGRRTASRRRKAENWERKAESPIRRAERGGRMSDQIFCDAVIAAGIFYLVVCLCFIACPTRGVRILRWSRKLAEKTENRRYS